MQSRRGRSCLDVAKAIIPEGLERSLWRGRGGGGGDMAYRCVCRELLSVGGGAKQESNT